LNLGGNSLTEVPQKALSILDTLKKLEMQENRLTEIREGDFEGSSFSRAGDVILVQNVYSLQVCEISIR
jgi:hypothetical protein